MARDPQPPGARVNLAALLGADVTRADLYRLCQWLEHNGIPLGQGQRPGDDPVRFRPHPRLGFPAAELLAVEPGCPATVRTRVLGLYGVDAPLPLPYLDDIARQCEGHEALEGFLDMFNHRIFTQFYRIWRKYAYPATFSPGGTDRTSRALLALVGLDEASHVATPASRFLALLGSLRMPTRNAEGVVALVRQLAPHTRVKVTPRWPRQIALIPAAGLGNARPVHLGDGTPLGPTGLDGNSQIRLELITDDAHEAYGWLPGGPLLRDLRLLLRMYLGWRCDAWLCVTLPGHCLPSPILGAPNLWLGTTAVMAPHTLTARRQVALGRYQGLEPLSRTQECRHVAYAG